MPSTLPAPEAKPATVRRMFDRIAVRYDLMNRLMTAGMDQRWRRHVVRRLGVGPTDVVLDLACGTGDFAAIARTRSSRVIGLDFSWRMLSAAQARHGFEVDLVQGDALRLPLRDGSVTAAVCGFALRNFASIGPVVHELGRVLEPGGRVGLLEVDRPRNAFVRGAHGLYFNRVVPLVGGIVSDGAAYRYLPDSVAYLPSASELGAMLKAAGFKDIRKQSLGLGAIQTLYAVRA